MEPQTGKQIQAPGSCRPLLRTERDGGGIEYYEDRKLDKAQIVKFSTCQYIERGHHIVLKGASGNGKTYIACAIGNAACRKYLSFRYIRMPELLDELGYTRANQE